MRIAGHGLPVLLRQTTHAALYRCRRESDDRATIAKLPRSELPTAIDIARLRHEHELLRSLARAPEVVDTFGLERCGNSAALLLEDLGDRSVETVIVEGGLDILARLELAVRMTDAVIAAHRARVIHKDLRPEHFCLIPDGGVRLIDFDIATTLEHENRGSNPHSRLEGTLAYMSPEQTGRMNRAVDRRSDLYSLGVTLYRLFAGTLPFPAHDPLELVHCHIARIPPPLREVDATIPRPLSNIVAKLLSKGAEDRYQEATGLRADLALCLAGLERGTAETFPLGRQDISEDLRVPAKLYGRERQLTVLLESLTRAAAGRTQLALVRGPSGTGKSALVGELNRSLSGAMVACGKFEQLERSIPYAPIVHACNQLTRAALALPGERLRSFSERMRRALGNNAALIVDLVPILGAIVGPQEAPPALGPAESQRRFELTFQSFLQAFATDEVPLVLFLDDLQWADAASLRLLHSMLTHPGRAHLLVIGAYRDNEVGPRHPLRLALEDLDAAGVTATQIDVGALDASTVAALLAETLSMPRERVSPLAELVLQKTQGNPFFVRQFLGAAYRDGWLRFDTAGRTWSWDAAAIESASATENVVDFILGELRRLSPQTQRLLQYAACIGHRFDQRTLSIVAEAEPAVLVHDLWEALQVGLIVPDGGDYRYAPTADDRSIAANGAQALDVRYRFLHDRVQEAALATFDEQSQRTTHLTIGRLLLAECDGLPDAELLFTVVDHMNEGAAGITDPHERSTLAHLDLRAARRARDAAAYGVATRLVDHCIELLGRDAWTTHPRATFDAHIVKADCSSVGGDLDGALQWLDVVSSHAPSTLDKVNVLGRTTDILTHQNRLEAAIECGLGALELLGVRAPRDALGPAIGAEIGACLEALGGRPPHGLSALSAMRDLESLALVDVIFKLVPAAYQSDQMLTAWIVARAVRTMLVHGHAPPAPHLYVTFGVIVGGVTGDLDLGYAFGELALALAERPEHAATRSAGIFVFASLLSHWRAPLSESTELLRSAYRAGLDAGDHLHAAYSLAWEMAHRLYAGEPLDALAQAGESTLATFASWSGGGARGKGAASAPETNALITSRIIAALREARPAPSFDTEELRALAAANRTSRVLVDIGAAYVLVTFGRCEEAVAHCDAADAALEYLQGFYTTTEHTFVRALVRAQAARGGPAEQREALLASVVADEATLRVWAEKGAANTEHRRLLVAAEIAALRGDTGAAMDLYDRAIARATEGGFVQHRALASELCARFHLSAGRAAAARGYLVEAYHAFVHWGARGPAAALAARHPHLSLDALEEAGEAVPVATRHTTTMKAGGATLDLISAIRATQTIMSELDAEKLIERLMRTLVECAGARRGCLVLAGERGLTVEACLTIEPDVIRIGLAEDVDATSLLPSNVARYVTRTSEVVILADVASDPRFADDAYFARNPARSVLCMSMAYQGRSLGLLYLENEIVTGAFTTSRVELLQFLAAQAAVALENARLYASACAARDRLREANETLEQRVAQRTHELARRNREMQRVFANVAQGFLSVDRAGRLSRERSAAIDAWFGAVEDDLTLASWVERIDGAFAAAFALGFDSLVEDVLPLDVALEQLPRRLLGGERSYDVSYAPIVIGRRFEGLVVVLDDVTDDLRRAAEEAEQAETLALVEAFAADPHGLESFVEEAGKMVERLLTGTLDDETLKGVLHTLKGNAAMMRLPVLAQACHRAEDDLAAREPVRASASAWETIRRRWRALADTVSRLRGDRDCNIVEVSVRELDLLAEEVRLDPSAKQALARIASFRQEPTARTLRRLGRYAQALATRLGKSAPEVEVDVGDVLRFDAAWGPLVASLVHVLRNAVDHGLEAPEERAALGKAPAGRISVSLARKGGRVVLTIGDDGRGISWLAVADAAARRGLAHATQADLVAALLASDVSTRTEVTATSGRGAGMAAVAACVGALAGDIMVESRAGAGCTWRLSFPDTSAVSPIREAA